MKPGGAVIGILISVGLVYLAAWTGKPSVFLPAFAGMLAAVAWSLFLMVSQLIRSLLPRKLQHAHDLHPWRFRALLMVIGLFFAAGWVSIQKDSSSPAAPLSTEEELKALPYVTWVTPQTPLQNSGVILYDRERACPGWNVFDSANLSAAFLMDMSGNILHRWSIDGGVPWQHVEVLPNGDLWAIAKDEALIHLSLSSDIRSSWPLRIHHDIDFAANGDVYAITRKDEIVFFQGVPLPILNDYVVHLSKKGEVLNEFSLFPVLQTHLPAGVIWRTYRWMLQPPNLIGLLKKSVRGWIRKEFVFDEDTVPDLFHTNALEIIPEGFPPPFEKGNLLISVRQLNLVAVLSLARGGLVWDWGKEDLIRQHHPSLQAGGNILIFDNGFGRDFSRVLEVSSEKNILWEYTAPPANAFYSRRRGSCQRLPNGNTLITDSNSGRVFEVTKEGETVWEFHNPEINTGEGKRAAIYRMVRLTDPESFPFLRNFPEER